MIETIAAAKRQEVEQKKRARPAEELVAAAAALPPTRDFRAALTGKGTAIVAEVKRRSPSRGVLREGIDAAAVARLYEAHGAAAISVLTDQTFFGGSNEDLTRVKDAVGLPVLRKEFIIDPWQIIEARAIGADAILLIAALLDDRQLCEYRHRAALLGLACLVEVHDAAELDRALAAGAEIVGINNRDLRTFTTDLGTSLALAPRIPADRAIVAESGIRTRQEIELLAGNGVQAFLIGETLVTAPDIGKKLRELVGEARA